MSLFLIGVGLGLMFIAAIVLAPFLGLGMFFPGVGDAFDIPLAIVIGGVGIAMIFFGAVNFFLTYWWAFAIAGVLYFFLFCGKCYLGIKRLGGLTRG